MRSDLPEETAALVVEAKRLQAEAQDLKTKAAAANRAVARTLDDEGFSAGDGAFIMGISRQRFYQLLAG